MPSAHADTAKPRLHFADSNSLSTAGMRYSGSACTWVQFLVTFQRTDHTQFYLEPLQALDGTCSRLLGAFPDFTVGLTPHSYTAGSLRRIA